MKKFIKKHKNTLFRYWERKRMWTPYDIECKDPDQVEYGDEECFYGYFVDLVDLGYDWLIGISDDLEADYISYYKLNDLEFAYCASDQQE